MGIEIFLITLLVLILASFPLALFESSKVRLFYVRWYMLGIVVYRNAVIVQGGINVSGITKDIYTKDEGVYHFANDGHIYFRSLTSRRRWVLRTPFTFKCKAEILNNDIVEITARLPLGITILFCCVLIIGLMMSFLPAMPGLPFLIFPVLIFLISYYTERSRLQIMLPELRGILSKGR